MEGRRWIFPTCCYNPIFGPAGQSQQTFVQHVAFLMRRCSVACLVGHATLYDDVYSTSIVGVKSRHVASGRDFRRSVWALACQTFLPKNLSTGSDNYNQLISGQQYCSLIWPASNMPHPFQCIATVATEGGSYLLAACGPKLLSLSAKDGSIASQWTSDAAVSFQITWVCPRSGR